MTLPSLATTTRPASKGYLGAFDDLLIRGAVGPGRELRFAGAPLSAPKVDTGSNAEEFTSDYGTVYARDDFTGGEGLLRAHDRDLPVNASRRYWDSRNIDTAVRPAGELRDIRLLHTTELADSSASSGLRMVWTGSRLMRAGATTIRVAADPIGGAFSNEDPHNGEAATTVEDVAFLGTDEFAALGANGIHRQQNGGGWSHYSDLQADRLWSVGGDKQRLVARGNSGRSLYEVVASGAAPSALITLPPGETFNFVCDGGGSVLAAASNGYIYAYTVNSSGNLELLGQTYIPGEQVTFVQGTGTQIVVFGTRTLNQASGYIGRLYTAELTTEGVLDQRQTIRQWGDEATTIDRGPRTPVASRDAVYMIVREDSTETHVWRYDLSGGLARWWIISAAGLPTGAALVKGRFVCGLDALGTYRQTATYAATGYLISPFGDLFNAGEKNWVVSRLETDEIPAGGRVDLFYSTDTADMLDADASTWARALYVDAGDSGSVEDTLTGIYARGIVGKIEISKGTSDTPKVRSFGFLSQPGASDVVIEIPVDVGDQVEKPGRQPFIVKGRGAALWAALEAKRGRATTLTLFRPDGLYSGQILNLTAPTDYISARGSVTKFALVEFRGRSIDAAVEAEEGSALGMGVIGMDILGGVAA